MSNIDDLKKYSVNYNCKLCNEFNEHLEVCNKCFLFKLMPHFVTKEPSNKWRRIKRYSYGILFVFIPPIIIGLYLGIKIEWLCIGSFIYGLLVDSIINWCMRKF